MKKCFGKLYTVIIFVMILGSACAKKDVDQAASEYSAAEELGDERRIENAESENDAGVDAAALHNLRAEYTQYLYDGKAQTPAYTVEKELANIVNLNQFTDRSYYYHVWSNMTDDVKNMIFENGFAVDDSDNEREYFGVYESNRYNYVPSFITTDSATHTFHLMFDYVLKNLEQEKLAGVLKNLGVAMTQNSIAQYEMLQSTDFENAAKRNIAFFSIGAKLIDESFDVPDLVKSVVNAEIALINAQDGISASPLLSQEMDYSQYAPRGHYTQTKALKAYFKAQKWYGMATFRSANEDEVKSALLQTAALQNKKAQNLFYTLFDTISFFVGECDDLGFAQYADVLKSVYKNQLGDVQTITMISDAAKFADALKIIQKLPPPKINDIPIYTASIQPDRDNAISGYRFLGSRFTIDASIFQRLMDRETPDRMLPKALDIPAALGSQTAISLLQHDGEMDAYPEYGGNLKKVQAYLKTIDTDTWTSNLYWAWLYMLLPLTENPDKSGLPFFMQNTAWDLKSLNTFEGSWTELKHDTVLYTKESMAEKGGDGDEPPPPPDDRGYVEPNPVLFGRLASLVDMTINVLKSRDLLTAQAAESLGVLSGLAHSLAVIAEKELSGTERTEAEYKTIRNYGGELEHIWYTAKKEDIKNQNPEVYLYLHPGAIVADLASDPNGRVLEEATGYAKVIYVAFPRNGDVVLGRGVVYSHYEFIVPLNERMTDEAWHERLINDDIPDSADWKKVFMANVKKSRAISR
ncbi:MAG: DUF3160 domain-containing protein [Spirochaetaceae bacterium]|nr:DUF3160 domain-containing protein [Spirochaetaceae bacterium]